MKKLLVTLEIDVVDLPDSEREICAQGVGMDVAELETLDDYPAEDIANVIPYGLTGPDAGEMFAGSDVLVKFQAAKVVSAGWSS